jgi:predicted O-methyltransferase YrrM
LLLEAAATHVDAYIERIAGVAHDLKGIRPSEGFFIFALLASDPPLRILESGRGRGYSTEILARCFPAARIISV